MNTLTVFIISVAKTIYILCNSLFEFLYSWSNNVDIWGNIPNWISAIFSIIAGIVIPLKLYELGKKDELARKNENIINEKRNQKLLSVERCGKLYSKPIIDRLSNIDIYTNNYYINLNEECIITNTNDSTNINDNYIKISIPLKEEGVIDISSFLLKNVDLYFSDNNNIYLNEFHFNKTIDNNFKNTFKNNGNTILNIFISCNDKSNLLYYFKTAYYCRIVLELNVINPFNIQTNGTWNAILILEPGLNIHDDSIFSYKIKDSLLRIEEIIDKNLEEQK